jgi:hypothetical protein
MRQLLTAAILGLTITACAATPSPSTGAPALVAIPTAGPPVGQVACMDALLTGQLVADEDAGVAIQAADGATTVVVWPNGWVAVDQGGKRVVVNDRGDPVAQVGDQVAIGGGLGAGDRWYTCGEVTRPVR